MTGLYENISALQNNKSLTFLPRFDEYIKNVILFEE